MEKAGEVDSLLPMIKCFELSKRLDSDIGKSQGLKMLVLARLTNKLEASSKDYVKIKIDGIMTRHINKAKTALYTTLAIRDMYLLVSISNRHSVIMCCFVHPRSRGTLPRNFHAA